MREVVKRARSAAKIPDLTFRICRTTLSSLFEGDIKDAQEILGHHSAAFTLQVYKKPLAERQQTAVQDVDRRLKVVPIKKGGSLTVSSTAVHTGTEKANVFSHLVVPV